MDCVYTEIVPKAILQAIIRGKVDIVSVIPSIPKAVVTTIGG